VNHVPLLLIPWRAALLWLLSIAPWGAPLEANLFVDSRGVAAGGLIFFALVAALLVRRVELVGRRDPLSITVATTALVSLALSAGLPRGTIPLATGAVIVAPLLWGCAWIALRRWAPTSKAPGFFLLCVVLISWALGGRRVLERERVWDEVLVLDGRWAVAHHARIDLAAARNADARARDALAERCFSLCPQDVRCASLATAARVRAEDCARVIEAARVALRASSDRASLEAAVRCADTLARSDDESLAWARRAVAEQRSDEALRRMLAAMLERRGDRTGAFEALRAGGELRSADGVVTMARLAIERGDDAAARAAIESLLQREPAHVEARFMRAWIEHRAGRFNPARENYLRALQGDPSHFAARYNLARLLLSAGVAQEALRHAQRLLETHARDPRVRQLARDIQGAMAQADDAGAGP
jgi:tetratricopeptide (TPR) repeat protein